MIGWVNRLWRRWTDVEVSCGGCGKSLGYVVRGGHAAWVCGRCSGIDGMHHPLAVASSTARRGR